jgi:hypothetical protein
MIMPQMHPQQQVKCHSVSGCAYACELPQLTASRMPLLRQMQLPAAAADAAAE